MTAPGAHNAGWDEYGERIVASDVCLHCGEQIDQWELRIESRAPSHRPVLLWKHHLDGAVLCGRSQPATPTERS